MPGSVVNQTSVLIDLSILGEVFLFDCREGDILSVSGKLVTGTWGTVSVKRTTGGSDPRDFSSAVSFTSNNSFDALETDGADTAVLRVDATNTGRAEFTFVLKGDRLPVVSKLGLDSVQPTQRADSAFDSPGGGSGL